MLYGLPDKHTPANAYFMFLLALLILILSLLPAKAQEPPNNKYNFSILGTEREVIYSVFSSTEPQKELPQEYAPGRAGQELLDFIDQNILFRYSREKWIRMKRIEQGELPREPVIISTEPIKPSLPPLPEGLAVELPYESHLSISGRKLIGINFKSTIYEE